MQVPRFQSQGQWLRVPGCNSAEVAERSYPLPKARGGSLEEPPHIQGVVVEPCRRAERSYSTFKVRRGSCEQIPLVQGKEQWLRFAGAAMKRYPTSKAKETQVRQ